MRGFLGNSELVAISADIQSGDYYSKKYIFDYIPTDVTNNIGEIVWNGNISTLLIERRGLYIDDTTYGLAVTFNDDGISFEKTEPPTKNTYSYTGKSSIFEYDGKKFQIDYRTNTLETIP